MIYIIDMEDLYFLVITSILSLTGGFVGIKYINSRSTDSSLVKKKIALYNDTIQELEEEARHWKGKYAGRLKTPQVEGEFNLSDAGSVQSLIGSILPKLGSLLPKDLQGLASDPKIVEYAMKLYQEHPEEAKKLFSKFISRGVKTGTVQSTELTAL